MNISLSKAAQKKKKNLGYGLNSRKTAAATGNVLGGNDNDSNDESETGGDDDRAAVNRDLRAEQEALKKRAAATLDVYDYDGAYDSMQPNKNQAAAEEKKSRYIGDLLQAAKRREREREIIRERKISKEQAAEEAEYEDKDKFVTKAYKRKLAERELWAREQEERLREEKVNDVTKKTGDGAFASFYGNLNRNVAMGGGEMNKEETKHDEEMAAGHGEADKQQAVSDKSGGLGFLDGFEQSTTSEAQEEAAMTKSDSASPAAPRMTMREAREEKLAQARLRYFQRQGLSEDGLPQKQ